MADFNTSLTASLTNRGIAVGDFRDLSSLVENRIIAEYGAVFLNADAAVKMPDRCRFADEAEVAAYNAEINVSKKTIGGKLIELQKAAMDSLLKVAARTGGAITPKGSNPARRSFAAVQISWDKTIDAGADYWTKNANSAGHRLSAEQAETLKSLTGEAQIKTVLELEARGFLFHPEHDRSVTVYTAIPGASQHLLMLALDVEEYADEKARAAFAENGWFQTVYRDRPHFTYLGVKQSDLPALGLETKQFEGRDFWIPKVKP